MTPMSAFCMASTVAGFGDANAPPSSDGGFARPSAYAAVEVPVDDDPEPDEDDGADEDDEDDGADDDEELDGFDAAGLLLEDEPRLSLR